MNDAYLPDDHGNPQLLVGITKRKVLLLQKAVDHYIKFQLGVNSREAKEYKAMLKMLENKITLLDW